MHAPARFKELKTVSSDRVVAFSFDKTRAPQFNSNKLYWNILWFIKVFNVYNFVQTPSDLGRRHGSVCTLRTDADQLKRGQLQPRRWTRSLLERRKGGCSMLLRRHATHTHVSLNPAAVFLLFVSFQLCAGVPTSTCRRVDYFLDVLPQQCPTSYHLANVMPSKLNFPRKLTYSLNFADRLVIYLIF
jgi:hypothetical protein